MIHSRYRPKHIWRRIKAIWNCTSVRSKGVGWWGWGWFSSQWNRPEHAQLNCSPWRACVRDTHPGQGLRDHSEMKNKKYLNTFWKLPIIKISKIQSTRIMGPSDTSPSSIMANPKYLFFFKKFLTSIIFASKDRKPGKIFMTPWRFVTCWFSGSLTSFNPLFMQGNALSPVLSGYLSCL